MNGLTPRQQDALRFIREYIDLYGHAPSYREIKDGIGLASKSGVARLVSGLAARGAITYLPHSERSIRLVCSLEFAARAVLSQTEDDALSSLWCRVPKSHIDALKEALK